MIDLAVVREALKRSKTQKIPASDQDGLTSLLIHDVFGGEILKTRKKKGWHFYNRIDGLRLDLTKSEITKSLDENCFEDIPATPAETSAGFEKEQYSAFFMNFVTAFEEIVGLRNYRPDYSN
jgi:hypothetical protein